MSNLYPKFGEWCLDSDGFAHCVAFTSLTLGTRFSCGRGLVSARQPIPAKTDSPRCHKCSRNVEYAARGTDTAMAAMRGDDA